MSISLMTLYENYLITHYLKSQVLVNRFRVINTGQVRRTWSRNLVRVSEQWPSRCGNKVEWNVVSWGLWLNGDNWDDRLYRHHEGLNWLHRNDNRVDRHDRLNVRCNGSGRNWYNWLWSHWDDADWLLGRWDNWPVNGNNLPLNGQWLLCCVDDRWSC